MNREDALKIMESMEVKTTLTSTEFTEVEAMVKTKGFQHYLSLLLGSKQAYLVALANTSLGTAEKSCQASVLQGTVKGIDLAFETVVELFTPDEKDTDNVNRT